jgi:YD repeat-containing protein
MADPGARTGVTSPPAGTGQAAGLGEAFRINLNTGQGVYTYKLPLPAGVAKHTPTLSIEYAHGHGNGPFGFGWRLDERRIGRRLDYGLEQGELAERFMDSGVEIAAIADGSFRALAETAFTRYRRDGDGWRAEERTGLVHEFGMTPGARLADPDRPERVTEWLLERSIDACGNVIAYAYDIHDGTAYLREIRYAAYAVRLGYEDRPDVRVNARAGYARRLARRCARVELFLDPGPAERRIRSWTFAYGLEPVSHVSLLDQVTLASHGAAVDGSQDLRRAPVRFTYTPFDPARRSVTWIEPDGSEPPPLSDDDVALVTLDDAPLPGILQVVNGRQYYWRNRGGAWSHPAPVARTPRLSSFSRAGVAFVDVDASGTPDMIQAGSDEAMPGYYENGGRQGWSRFVAYPRDRHPAPAWTSGRLRLADLDGDGRVDATMSTRRAFALWLNQGARGWSDPVLAPLGGDDPPDVDFGDPAVHLADMTGDGVPDIVRVRSGLVEYWPGLGFGRYGRRVQMRGSPRLRDLARLPGNLLLLDVNGDGCADLVFVTADGIEIHCNRNGESYGDAIVVDVVPPPVPDTIRAADLSGRGRAGLVYNSRRSRGLGYVSVTFGGDEAPLLLSRVDSGTGLVSEIRYRAAVEDYLDDLAAGERWDTNFPFPLQVVASTIETDLVSGQAVEIAYRYHQAHYESRTRQFQGFRRAERIEKGDDSRADTVTAFHFLMAQERVPGHGPEHAALNGMMRRTEVYGRDGSASEARPFTVEEADYAINGLGETADGRKRAFLCVTARRTEDPERTDDVRGEERTYEYDEFGNVVRERLRGYGVRAGVPQPERIRVTETEYARTPDGGLTGRPCRIVVRGEDGEILTEIRRFYDGPDFVGLPLGQVRRGLVSRETHLVLAAAEFQAHYAGLDDSALGYFAEPDADGDAAFFVESERHAHDARGLRVADRDALGHEHRYGFDAAGLLRTSLVDALGETTFEYDRACGEPTRIVYADGSETRLTYDAQGRILSVLMPGDPGGQPARTMAYDDLAVPNARTTTHRHGPGGAGTSRSVMYYDGRSKEFQERIEADGGRFVVSNLARRNPWGDVKEEFEPLFDASAAFSIPPLAGRPSRRFFFDARGRVVKTINHNGGVSTARYLPFEIITADANDTDASPANVARGQFDTPRREELDVLRDRTKTVEASGSSSELTTTFLTGPLGELLEVRDGHGVMCRYTYDRIGNRLRLDHREAGTRRIWFDARRKAVRAVDARGRDVRAEIDARGRIGRLSVDGAVVEQYTYDDPARHALGRLAEVSYRGGRQSFHYDAAGRLERHDHFFDGHAAPHSVTYEYDGLGRQIARTHTGGLRIARELTPNGWVRAIPGFVNAVEYDARGLPIDIRYANGVTTTSTYTEGTGRLKSRRTTGPGGQVFEDATFDYDLLQMLLASHDAAPAGRGTRTYAYDPLYQIVASTADEAGVARTRTYTYAAPFNLSGFGEADSQMLYDDPLHPDRVAGLIQGGGPRADVRYDANGNTTELSDQRLAYDFKDMLERYEGAGGLSAEYRYDHTASRISKRRDAVRRRPRRDPRRSAGVLRPPRAHARRHRPRRDDAVRARRRAGRHGVLLGRRRDEDHVDRLSPVRQPGIGVGADGLPHLRRPPVRRGVGPLLHEAPLLLAGAGPVPVGRSAGGVPAVGVPFQPEGAASVHLRRERSVEQGRSRRLQLLERRRRDRRRARGGGGGRAGGDDRRRARDHSRHRAGDRPGRRRLHRRRRDGGDRLRRVHARVPDRAERRLQRDPGDGDLRAGDRRRARRHQFPGGVRHHRQQRDLPGDSRLVELADADVVAGDGDRPDLLRAQRRPGDLHPQPRRRGAHREHLDRLEHRQHRHGGRLDVPAGIPRRLQPGELLVHHAGQHGGGARDRPRAEQRGVREHLPFRRGDRRERDPGEPRGRVCGADRREPRSDDDGPGHPADVGVGR